jgi:large subunit ribosomal protein L21
MNEDKASQYAIIRSGSKQYRVKQGDLIDVELLHAEDGTVVQFEEVLLVANGSDVEIGAPNVSKYVVRGEILGESKGPKIHSVKYHPNHTVKKTWGHRQHYSRVKITEIQKVA